MFFVAKQMLLAGHCWSPTGVQKAGTAGTTGVGQTTCGWNNWTFGSLSRDKNSLSNRYWTHCPINIEF